MNNKIHETNSLIVLEHDIVEKTKEFLKKLSHTPIGVVLKLHNVQNPFAVVYERDRFVIVAPNGTHESARLYGNWDEAINNVRKFLKENCASETQSQFLLTEYQKVSM